MKHIFIINPAAGKGDSKKFILPRIIHFVKNHGDDFEIHRTLNKQEVGAYVKARASLGDPVRFYAVGGDGTICDVLNGMAEFGNAELSFIPCGSGNDFARNFSHKELFFNLEALTHGNVEYVDVIKFNDNYSMNMLNIGADAAVADRSCQLRKQGLAGSASYIKAALEIIPNAPKYAFDYSAGHGEIVHGEFMLSAIANGRYCGGGFHSCPKASINDGLLDIALVRPVHGKKLLPLLWKYHQGTYIFDENAREYYEYIQTPEFWIKPLDDATLCIDGEIEPAKEMHVKVIHNAIKVAIPIGSKIL